MARLPTKFLGPLSLASAVGTAALAAREHWRLLSPAERRRLAALLRASRGRVTALSAAERRELSASPGGSSCCALAAASRPALRRSGPGGAPETARPAASARPGPARGSGRRGARLQTARHAAPDGPPHKKACVTAVAGIR